jgi:hypothetical protein
MRKSREESHIKWDLPACLSPEGEGKYLYINKAAKPPV